MPLYFKLLEISVVSFFLGAGAQLTMLQMHGEILGGAPSLST